MEISRTRNIEHPTSEIRGGGIEPGYSANMTGYVIHWPAAVISVLFQPTVSLSLTESRKLAPRVRDYEIKGKVYCAHPRGWCTFACKGWNEKERKIRGEDRAGRPARWRPVKRGVKCVLRTFVVQNYELFDIIAKGIDKPSLCLNAYNSCYAGDDTLLPRHLDRTSFVDKR